MIIAAGAIHVNVCFSIMELHDLMPAFPTEKADISVRRTMSD
jgi:hypothetical protein